MYSENCAPMNSEVAEHPRERHQPDALALAERADRRRTRTPIHAVMPSAGPMPQATICCSGQSHFERPIHCTFGGNDASPLSSCCWST